MSGQFNFFKNLFIPTLKNLQFCPHDFLNTLYQRDTHFRVRKKSRSEMVIIERRCPTFSPSFTEAMWGFISITTILRSFNILLMPLKSLFNTSLMWEGGTVICIKVH